MPVVGLGLGFSYGDREILDGVSFALREGQVTALVGPSGSGKSTLISMLLGYLKPHTGSLSYPDELLCGDRVDRRRVAWVMQTANAFGRRSALENVALPLRLRRVSPESARERAAAALSAVGLPDRASDRVRFLSGGQRQRVAVARAIAAGCPLVIADEPTVALDQENRRLLVDAFRSAARSGAMVLLATHDPQVSSECDAVISLV